MTLFLEGARTDPGLSAKTSEDGGVYIYTRFEEMKISLEDFLALAEYVLTNTDLVPDDKRLTFVKRMASMQLITGWNGSGSERLGLKELEGP